MLVFKIVGHSVSMVWRNKIDAAQVALPFVITTLLLQCVALFGFGQNLLRNEEFDFVAAGVGGWLVGLLYLLNGLATLYVYVAWHRFILLGSYPKGLTLDVPPMRMLAYFGYGLAVGAVVAVIGAVFGGGIGLIGGIGTGLATLVALCVVPLILVLSARLSVVLPSAAIGSGLGLKGAWHATKGASVTCGLGLLLIALVAFVIVIPAGALSILPAPLSFALAVPFTTAATLVVVSFLTTLYGYYVEHRELD